ncbi:MAG: hypothetical protein DDT38_01632 [Firmicutes bacterium]|nr:hypothetical protein [candidate division NPL-UPA2 bacterium]
MKHFFLSVLFFLVVYVAYAQTGVPTPAEPRLMVGPDGTLVSGANPLPVADARAAPPSTLVEATTTLATSTVHTIAPVAGRDWITLKAYPANTVPIWISFNNASVPAVIGSGYPLAPGAAIARRMPAGFTVGVIASTTAVLFHSQEVR